MARSQRRLLLITLLPGDRGLYRLIGLLRDRAALQADIRALEARRRKLEMDVRRFTSDPATIERVAREDLDLVRKGETVYKFPPSR
jgi:cell division protein FtsB